MTHVISFSGLYGDSLAGTTPDTFHYEAIRDRSSRHNWTIRLHRHAHLAQIFLFRTADVTIKLGDIEHTSTEPTLLLVPPGVPHGFRFDEGVDGDVLSLRISALPESSIVRLEAFRASGGFLLSRSVSSHFAALDTLVRQFAQVFQSFDPHRSALLSAQIELLLTYLSAEQRGKRALAPSLKSLIPNRHEQQAEEFCNLVEAQFYHNWAVGDYAAAIGVSAPHLTRVCKSILGSAPNELVRQRRILEAKRLLEFTRLPISVVAHRSGYRDPAFFSRAFKVATGVAPQQYRRDA